MTGSDSPRVGHIITGLGMGGAERTLYNLLQHASPGRFEHRVLSLTGKGPMGEHIRQLGVPVDRLDMRPGFPSPAGFLRAVGWLRRARPAVVQAWMYHANLLATLAAPWALSPPVIWNLRASDMTPGHPRKLTPNVVRLSARLSRRPQAVVVNSAAGQRDHARLGYRPRRWVLIRNGVDPDHFRPDEQARREVRQELGVGESDLLIGMVARFDPKKDHAGFLEAVGHFLDQFGAARFLLCGGGIERSNPQLMELLRPQQVQTEIALLGPRRDVARLMAALDVATLSSAYGEGFPNVVAEAMACGVPCVVTDVGDAGAIVGDTGIVVQPGDPMGLAQGWQRMSSMQPNERQALGQRARQRVQQEYPTGKMVDEYEDLYQSTAARRRGGI